MKSPNVFHALPRNLRAGLRAALFRHVEPKSIVPSPEQLILTAVLAIALGPLLSRTFYDGPAVFNWSQVRGLWLELPLFLLVGWMGARFTTLKVSPLSITIVLFAAFLTIEVVMVSVLHVFKSILPLKELYLAWSVTYYASYVWLWLLGMAFVRRTVQLAGRRLVLAVSPLVLLGAYDIFVPRQPIWFLMPAGSERFSSSSEFPVTEEMLYLQPRLADQALKGLLPGKPDMADVYFVGFAPYGHEDVFLKESEVIRALMDQRFGTRGRSLLLANNSKSLRRYPLATVTNLRMALSHIGKLIDKEQDVLVLYLTSHGSKTHRLSADYWPLQLEELDPVSLKQVLDDAGIKWRVIAVSACYSGGFVEPLRGPTTLIMTASDATRTSFGCGAESEFTYFAKAVFDEQLRQTYSFEEAFRRAVPVIQQREKEVREEFSNPQIAVGDAIRKKLSEVERRLRATRP